jgi:hypothetical protein
LCSALLTSPPEQLVAEKFQVAPSFPPGTDELAGGARDFSVLIHITFVVRRLCTMLGVTTTTLAAPSLKRKQYGPWMPRHAYLILAQPREGLLRVPCTPWTLHDLALEATVKDLLSISWYGAKSLVWRAAETWSLLGQDVSTALTQAVHCYKSAVLSVPALVDLHYEHAMTLYFLYLQEPRKHQTSFREEGLAAIDRALSLKRVPLLFVTRGRFHLALNCFGGYIRSKHLAEAHADLAQASVAEVALLLSESRRAREFPR